MGLSVWPKARLPTVQSCGLKRGTGGSAPTSNRTRPVHDPKSSICDHAVCPSGKPVSPKGLPPWRVRRGRGLFCGREPVDQSKKAFLADFTTRRFVPVYSAFILFRINRHKTQVKSGGGSLEGGACSPLNGRQPDKSPFASLD